MRRSRQKWGYVEANSGVRETGIYTGVITTFWSLARQMGDISLQTPPPYPNLSNHDDIWELFDHLTEDDRWFIRTRLEQKGLWPLNNCWSHQVSTRIERGTQWREETLSRTLTFQDLRSSSDRVELTITIRFMLSQVLTQAFVNFSLYDRDMKWDDEPTIKSVHEQERPRRTTMITFGYSGGHFTWRPYSIVIPELGFLDPQVDYHQHAIRQMRRLILVCPCAREHNPVDSLCIPDFWPAYYLLCAGGDLRGDKRRIMMQGSEIMLGGKTIDSMS